MQKLKKTWFLHTHCNQDFGILVNNSRSKQNLKKTHTHGIFYTLLRRKYVQNFSKNYLTLWYLELAKVVSFSYKIHGFLEIKALSKFRYQSVKANFILTTPATLKYTLIFINFREIFLLCVYHEMENHLQHLLSRSINSFKDYH